MGVSETQTPIQIILDELMAGYLMASLTPEEQKGIESTVQDKLTVLKLPPSFHWVKLPPNPAPMLLKRLHLATVPNGGPRIQLVYSGDTIVEVNILNP
jgi:hypothetical protein